MMRQVTRPGNQVENPNQFRLRSAIGARGGGSQASFTTDSGFDWLP